MTEINEETRKEPLLPCPFCGRPDPFDFCRGMNAVAKRIVCPGCGSQANTVKQWNSRSTETCEWMGELDKLLQDLFARLAGLVGCQQTDKELCLRVAHMLSKVQRDRKLIESKQTPHDGRSEG